jgi:hypothetical protein
MEFTRQDLEKKEITFKGEIYKIGNGAYNVLKLNSNLWRLFKLKNGKIYAYSKIDKLVYRTF